MASEQQITRRQGQKMRTALFCEHRNEDSLGTSRNRWKFVWLRQNGYKREGHWITKITWFCIHKLLEYRNIGIKLSSYRYVLQLIWLMVMLLKVTQQAFNWHLIMIVIWTLVSVLSRRQLASQKTAELCLFFVIYIWGT